MSESVPDVTRSKPAESARREAAATRPLLFFDTTLRDGEQSPGCVHVRPRKAAHGPPDRPRSRRHPGGRLRHRLPRATPNPSATSPARSALPRTPPSSPPSPAPSGRTSRPARSTDPGRLAAPASTPFSPPPTCTSPPSSRSPRGRGARQDRRDWSALARTYQCGGAFEFSPRTPTRNRPRLPRPCLARVSHSGWRHGTLNPPGHRRSYCLSQDYVSACSAWCCRTRSPASKNIVLSAHCRDDDLGLAVATPRSIRLDSCQVGVRRQRHRRARRPTPPSKSLAAMSITQPRPVPFLSTTIVMNQLLSPPARLLAT